MSETELKSKPKHGLLSSSWLHIIAMMLMLCDHAWAMLFPAAEWLTCIGRLAFPIFAFMIAEGAAHTHSMGKYMLRMLFWAVISEIPFNLMMGGSIFYPFDQNVMWTFLISLIAIFLLEKVKRFKFRLVRVLLSIPIVLAAVVIGLISMVDYNGGGVLTVLVFYFFPSGKWWGKIGQFVMMYWINFELLGGFYYEVQLFGHTFGIVQQGLAVFALIPIWFYNGERGNTSKSFRRFCYAFYPAHLLILFVIRSIILR